MTDEEKFFAWLDGELTDAEAADMERLIASDPELAAMVQKHRSMEARLRGAFDSIAEAQVPDRLRSAATATQSNVLDMDARRRGGPIRGVPQWALIAATLVVGVFAGSLLPGRSEGPIEVEGGTLYAAGALDRGLETQLASAPGRASLRVGITFRNSADSICRTFTAEAATGLACRDKGRWQVQGLFPVGEGQQSEFRMAAGMNPALAELVGLTMTGEPLNAQEETAARDRGWR